MLFHLLHLPFVVLHFAFVAVLFITGSMSVAQSKASGHGEKIKTFTGTVTDTMCGAKHMAKNKSAAECTRECVKMGSDYVLIVGDNVYTLKGDAATIDKFAGQKATVNGKQSGNAIAVESISSPKAEGK